MCNFPTKIVEKLSSGAPFKSLLSLDKNVPIFFCLENKVQKRPKFRRQITFYSKNNEHYIIMRPIYAYGLILHWSGMWLLLIRPLSGSWIYIFLAPNLLGGEY